MSRAKHLHFAVVACLAFVSACSSNSPPGSQPDCSAPCACCASGQRCFEDQCCTPSCGGKACGPDGCGGNCPNTCEAGYVCNDPRNRCECAAESDEAFCHRMNKECGLAVAADLCGKVRQIACDSCPAPSVCDPEAERCVCTGESAAELCRAAGAACGPLTATDKCGESRSVECGDCGPQRTCDPATNQCLDCVAETPAVFCQRLGKNCGTETAADNCGITRTHDCGSCQEGWLCNATSHRCELCTPQSAEDFCRDHGNANCGTVAGTDNCLRYREESCGECTPPSFCEAGVNRCHACVPESNTTFCARQNRACGRLTGTDNCANPRDVADCGGCPASQYCSNGQCVVCQPETDLELCNFFFKSCGTPTLVDRCGATRTPACGSCSGSTSCQPNGVCGTAGVATNNLCATPERLVFDANGVATLTADNTTGVNNYHSACNGEPTGRDLVYAFDVLAGVTQNVVVTVTPASGSSMQPAVSIRDSCSPSAAEKACGRNSSVAPLTIASKGLAGGTYYVFVDGYNTSTNGPFTMTVTLGVPPANDQCGGALPVPLAPVSGSGELSGTVNGDTATAADDYTSSCNSSSTGADLVYSFEVPAGTSKNARVDVTPSSGSGLKPVVSVRVGCAVGAVEKGCVKQTTVTAASLPLRALGAGTYYVFVDGYSTSTNGPFQLMVTLSDAFVPGNDTCATPSLLAFNGTTATASDDTWNAADDYNVSCSSTALNGGDLVYALHLTATAAVTAKVTRDPAATSYTPAVQISTACPPTAAAILGCGTNSSGVATARASALPAGDYFVIVDGTGATGGGFALEVTTAAAVENDLCIGAVPVPLALGTSGKLFGTAAGDTTSAVDDYVASCDSSSTGRDVVYSFEVPAGTSKSAVVEVVPSSGSSMKPLISLRVDCGVGATEKGCISSSTVATTALVAKSLPAATYYVFVDGYSTTSNGPFTLNVTLSDPPVNDLCLGALAVPLVSTPATGEITGSLAGDTTLANDDFVSSCNSSSTGADLVYSFEVPAGTPKDAIVEVAPSTGSALKPVVSIRESCQTGAAEKGCVKQTAVANARLISRMLPAGTYLVFVDGYSASSNGGFTLQVTLREPAAVPLNDSCSRPEPLTLGPSGLTQVDGYTLSAADDSAGSCATSSVPHTGGDVVYHLNLAQAASLAVSVARDPGDPSFRPAVYLRTACASATGEQACGNESSGIAKLSKNSLAAGDYYIVVDGIAGTSGAFTLTVASLDPVTNDTCATAKPLAFNGLGTASGRVDTCQATDTLQSGSTGNCSTLGLGPDVFYQFTLGARKNLEVVMHPGHTGTSLIYLRTTCPSASSEIACNSVVGTNTLRASKLPQGTYFLVLDNYSGNCGLMDFTVTLSDPPPPPLNDTCAQPETVFIDSATGIGTASGSTLDATNAFGAGCTSGTGGDLVYRIDLGQTQSLLVRATPQSGSALKPVLSLRGDCLASSSEAACKAMSTVAAAEIQIPRLSGGTYYVVVDSYTAAATGPFDLQVQVTAPTQAAPNDLCSAATPMPAFAANKSSITGTTFDGGNDDTSYCATSSARLNGPDLVYSFTLSAPAAITAKVTRGAGNTTYRPAVSIRSSCALTDEDACAVDSSGSSTASASLDSGTYYVFVDGIDSTYGPFTLELTQAAALPGDSCGLVKTLAFNGGDTASDTATLSATTATNGGYGTCSSSFTGPDLVYAMTLPSEKYVTVTMGPAAGNTQLNPQVSIRRTCDDKATEVGCAYTVTNGGTATLSTSRLAAGTYYLFADCYSTSYAGAFVLTVTLADPVTPVALNDVCARAALLTLDPVSNSARATGDTRDAFDDYAGSCATSSAPLSGADVVYAVNLPAPGRLMAAATRDSTTPSFLPGLYIRSACASGSAADEKDCGIQSTSTASYTTSSVVADLAQGLYYVIVDGQKGTAGKFTLDLAFRPASSPIANTACATAELLGFDANGVAEAVGDTSRGASNIAGTCTSAGPELVYNFTLGSIKDVTVDVIPGGSFEPAVYLRSSCGTASTQKDCQYSSSTTPVSMTAWKLGSGTYSVFVDSYSASYAGPFILRVKASDPLPPPIYDTCSGTPRLLALPLSGSPAVPLTDSTANAFNDFTSACATSSYPFDGPDVVYAFSLSAPAQVTAKVTPRANSKSYKPAVYIRTSCATVLDDACKYNSTAGSAVTLTASLQAGVTYYLVVDGVAGTAGDFDLELTQDTAKYVDGDHCVNARSLDALFTATASGGQTVTIGGDTLAANLVNDGDGSCVSATGPDFVYAFTVGSLSTVDIAVAPSGTGSKYTSGFYLRSVCGDASTQLTCQYTSLTNTPKSAQLMRVSPGKYYLWIDSYGTSSSYNGPFTATVTVTPMPPPPSNDTCAGVFDLGALPASGMVSQVGSTFSAANDYLAAGCGSKATDGGDVTYSFTLLQPSLLTAKVTRDVSSATYKPAIYLRAGTCASSAANDQVLCREVTDTTTTSAQLKAFTLGTGTYYLIVDGTDQSGGGYTLEVTTDAPRAYPDNCSSAVALSFGPTGHAQVSEDNTDAANDLPSPSCYSSGVTGGDLVYVVDTTSLGTKDLLATVNLPTGFYSSVLSLRSGCGAASTEVACSYLYAYSNTLAKASLAPGIYYLWVSATSSSYKGSFNLGVDLLDPPPAVPANDTCATAVDLNLDPVTGDQRLSGATFGGTGDPMSGACATMNGPEVVYRFAVARASAVYATVSRDALTPTYEPALHLRTQCPSSSATDQIGCASQTSGVAKLEKRLASGVYYLVVDGTNNTAGRFNLYVSVFPDVTNDDCGGAATLGFDPNTHVALVHSTTGLATDNTTSNSCNTSGTGYDVVYQVDVPAGASRDLYAEVVPLPGSAYAGVLSLRSACGTKTTELGCNYTSSSNTKVTWKWPNLAGGTSYYLWVDSYSSSTYNGAFELKATLAPHPAPPGNDDCGGAVALSFSSGKATVPNPTQPVGAIDEATNSGAGVACGTGATGPDVVYSFALRQDQKVAITLTPASTYAPTVYLRKGLASCASSLAGDEVGCATTTSGGTAVSITKNLLPADTYFLWVDSGTGGSGKNWGSYQLDVTLSAPVYPPAGDVCATAIPLVLNQTLNGDTSNALGVSADYPAPGTTWSSACSSYTYKPKGPDLVYVYTPSTTASFTVTATPASYDLLLWYTVATCGDAAACGKIMDADYGGVAESIAVTNVQVNVPYYFYVSAYSATNGGAFTIVVR